MCSFVPFFIFILFGLGWVYWICKFMFFTKYGKFLVLISSDIFLVLFSLSSQDSNYLHMRYLDIVWFHHSRVKVWSLIFIICIPILSHRCLRLYFISFLLLFLNSYLIISIALFSGSLHFAFVISILLLSSPSAFLFQIFCFLVLNFHLALFYIFYFSAKIYFLSIHYQHIFLYLIKYSSYF